MSRSVTNFWVDLTLATFFTAILAITAIVHFVFPPGTQAEGWHLWGLGYDAWCRIQMAVICAFAVCVLLHLILHWTWVCGFLAGRFSEWIGRKVTFHDSEKTVYGVATLIAVLCLLGAVVTISELRIRGPHPETVSSRKTVQISAL